MSILISEKDLAQELTTEQAVELAYPSELAEIAAKLQRGIPTLVECDKELVLYIFMNIRNRLKKAKLRCTYLDGRAPQQDGGLPQGMMDTMLQQLRDAVRGSVEDKVIVLPHLDLLTTTSGGLTSEVR